LSAHHFQLMHLQATDRDCRFVRTYKLIRRNIEMVALVCSSRDSIA
jgi:hypothetical protein